jgi:hypothetical protein
MATLNGSYIEVPISSSANGMFVFKASQLAVSRGGDDVQIFFMRAVDSNAPPVLYRTWTSRGRPDYAASQYVGPFSGVSRNFTSVTVTGTGTDRR